MPVLGIVSEVVEDEELKEEESYDENNWRNEDIIWNIDIVDTMYDACADNTCPESLSTFDICIVFPSECLLTEREVPRIVDESEEGKSASSVERHAHHAKECVWEVSKDGSEDGIAEDGMWILTCAREIEHIFDVFGKSKTDSDESNAVDIVCDTFCTEWSAQEIPEQDKSYECDKRKAPHK